MAAAVPYPHPAVTTDVVIFTIRQERLQVLLVKRSHEPYQGMWALPGGFADPDEDLESSAMRKLEEETGVTGVYLEQLYTFGNPGRDPRERVISVAYYALVPDARLRLPTAASGAPVACFGLDDLPALAFDHADIVNVAHQRLASKLAYSTIAFQFMPDKFALSDLQAVYEIILNRGLDKRNFRKQTMALGLIEETGEVRRNGNHRPARLYRLKHPGQVEIIR